MTVCIAAACESGRVVVAATDGAVNIGEIKSDNLMPKMIWLGDWLFMYAGEPSNADLFLDGLRVRADELKRENIKELVHEAFRKRLSRWSSDPVLGPFDMDIEEFKAEGAKTFGESRAAEFDRQIIGRSEQFYDQILVVGWGHTDTSILIHQEDKGGSVSHALPGFAAIGSGGATAASQLLLLKQARHSTLVDTLYSVAAAKFSAEVADGVGDYTTLWIGWKRRDCDDPDKLAGRWVQPSDIALLRELWKAHGMPKIPIGSYQSFMSILKKSGVYFEHSQSSAAKSLVDTFNQIQGDKKPEE